MKNNVETIMLQGNLNCILKKTRTFLEMFYLKAVSVSVIILLLHRGFMKLLTTA